MALLTSSEANNCPKNKRICEEIQWLFRENRGFSWNIKALRPETGGRGIFLMENLGESISEVVAAIPELV